MFLPCITLPAQLLCNLLFLSLGWHHPADSQTDTRVKLARVERENASQPSRLSGAAWGLREAAPEPRLQYWGRPASEASPLLLTPDRSFGPPGVGAAPASGLWEDRRHLAPLRTGERRPPPQPATRAGCPVSWVEQQAQGTSTPPPVTFRLLQTTEENRVIVTRQCSAEAVKVSNFSLIPENLGQLTSVQRQCSLSSPDSSFSGWYFR